MSRETEEREIQFAAHSIRQRLNVTGLASTLEQRALLALLADRDRLASDLQATRAELERVRRNHLRRMRDLIELILQVMPFTRDPHWWRHRERLLKEIRAALATMEPKV